MVDVNTIILTTIISIVSFTIIMMVLGPFIQSLKCKASASAAASTPPVAREAITGPCTCMNECYSGCGSGPQLMLLSRGKPVTITPPWQSYPGSNLTDGDYTTFAHSADWTSTTAVSAEIDLGQAYQIKKVKIFNRMDCCQDRFGEHSLLIDGNVIGTGDAKGAWEYEWCIDVNGQKVMVQMDGILNLGEIEVWGF
jgi:hypothetical protein